MELEAFEIKYGEKVKVVDKTVQTPPASLAVNKGDVITMLSLDGMYCKAKNMNGNIVYIAAWTKVKKWNLT